MPQAAQCVSQPPLRERVRHQRSDAYLVNRQSDVYEREGIDLDVSTLADWVDAAAATLMPLVDVIRDHPRRRARPRRRHHSAGSGAWAGPDQDRKAVGGGAR